MSGKTELHSLSPSILGLLSLLSDRFTKFRSVFVTVRGLHDEPAVNRLKEDCSSHVIDVAEEVELLLSLLERLETKEYLKLLLLFYLLSSRYIKLRKTTRVGGKVTAKYVPTLFKEVLC